MVYGVFLRCIFCKKRNYIGKTDYLPPAEAWDDPKFSLVDVSEMRGRAGMPLVCSTNWVYPELRHKIIDEFEREHKQMIETLIHSGMILKTIADLKAFFKRTGNEVGLLQTPIGEFIVPASVLQEFADTLDRVNTGRAGPVPSVLRKTKLFSKMDNTLLEQWRVVWNRCQCAFSGVLLDDEMALVNKWGREIEGTRIKTSMLEVIVRNSQRSKSVVYEDNRKRKHMIHT